MAYRLDRFGFGQSYEFGGPGYEKASAVQSSIIVNTIILNAVRLVKFAPRADFLIIGEYILRMSQILIINVNHNLPKLLSHAIVIASNSVSRRP